MFNGENNQNNDDEDQYDNPTQSIEKDAVVFQQSTTVTLPERRKPDMTFNSRKLSHDAPTYEIEKYDKNYLLIINHTNVDNFTPRLHTINDVNKLCNTFKKMRFAVEVVHELTKDEVMKKLDELLVASDFTDYGCVIVAVLSHGGAKGDIYARDASYDEHEIVDRLYACNNPTLFTKPKVLLIQACRGNETIKGIKTDKADEIDKTVEIGKVYTLPKETDLLLFHSSYPGKASMRAMEKWGKQDLGSVFIQTVCNKIDELVSVMDLESIFKEVKREVAIHFYTLSGSGWNIEKQMPVTTSTLTKKIHLKRVSEKPTECVLEAVDRPQTSVVRNLIHNSILINYPTVSQRTKLDGPCCCFLYHFDYLKERLRFVVADQPIDRIAKSLLDIADSIEDDGIMKTLHVKYITANVICNFLRDTRKGEPNFNFLYLP